MKCALCGLLCALVAATGQAAGIEPPADVAGAMSAGRAAGGGSHQADALGTINPTHGGMLPGYGTTAPETSYFSAGNGLLGPYSSTKKSACATSPAATPALQGECDAINQMAKQAGPGGKPPITIGPTDPLLTAGRPVQNDPQSVIGKVSATYSACSTKTVTHPGDYVMEQCTDWLTGSTGRCAVGEIVKLDPHYVYRCEETLASVASNRCFVPRVVEVDATYHYQCETTGHTASNPTCMRRALVSVSGGGQTNLPGARSLGSILASSSYSNLSCEIWRDENAASVRVICNDASAVIVLPIAGSAELVFTLETTLGHGFATPEHVVFAFGACAGGQCEVSATTSFPGITTVTGRTTSATIADPAGVAPPAKLASFAGINVFGEYLPSVDVYADGNGLGYVFLPRDTPPTSGCGPAMGTFKSAAAVPLSGGAVEIGCYRYTAKGAMAPLTAHVASCAGPACSLAVAPELAATSQTATVADPYSTTPYAFSVTWDDSECTSYAARVP
jgi:hypothetical protein